MARPQRRRAQPTSRPPPSASTDTNARTQQAVRTPVRVSAPDLQSMDQLFQPPYGQRYSPQYVQSLRHIPVQSSPSSGLPHHSSSLRTGRERVTLSPDGTIVLDSDIEEDEVVGARQVDAAMMDAAMTLVEMHHGVVTSGSIRFRPNPVSQSSTGPSQREVTQTTLSAAPNSESFASILDQVPVVRYRDGRFEPMDKASRTGSDLRAGEIDSSLKAMTTTISSRKRPRKQAPYNTAPLYQKLLDRDPEYLRHPVLTVYDTPPAELNAKAAMRAEIKRQVQLRRKADQLEEEEEEEEEVSESRASSSPLSSVPPSLKSDGSQPEISKNTHTRRANSKKQKCSVLGQRAPRAQAMRRQVVLDSDNESESRVSTIQVRQADDDNDEEEDDDEVESASDVETNDSQDKVMEDVEEEEENGDDDEDNEQENSDEDDDDEGSEYDGTV